LVNTADSGFGGFVFVSLCGFLVALVAIHTLGIQYNTTQHNNSQLLRERGF